MATTYTKLRSGAWGVRCTDAVTVGDTVTVTKRDGSVKSETIATIVWRGDGVTLAAIAAKGTATAAPARGRRTGCACGSIEDSPRDSDCASCQHDM
jgi:hypothetical protein